MAKAKARVEVVEEPKKQPASQAFVLNYEVWLVEIVTTTRMYGGIPQSPEVMREWIKAKGGIPEETLEDKLDAIPQDVDEKLELVSTGFRTDAGGVYFRDFMVKQMIKEAATVTELTTKKARSKNILTIGMTVTPEKIRPERAGVILLKEDGFEEIQGRVRTMRGYRSILSRKAYFDQGVTIPFSIRFLSNGRIHAEDIRKLLLHAGEFVGFGSARSREAGKFRLEKFEEA